MMTLDPVFRKVLYDEVIKRWRVETGVDIWESNTGEKIPKKHFSTSKNDNGSPISKDKIQKIQQDASLGNPNWIPASVRNVILNNQKVLKYIESEISFRPKNGTLKQKIERYNGYIFFQYIDPKVNPRQGEHKPACPIQYLNSYAIYCGYENFEDFIKRVQSSEINNSQREIQNKHLSSTEPINSIKGAGSDDEYFFEIPNHFYGVYEGTFIRPEKPTKKSNGKFSRLVLLLSPNKKVYVKTTHSIATDHSFSKKYYQGICTRKNEHTMHLSFSMVDNNSQKFEFVFVFHIFNEQHELKFDKYLKGIYAGSDPTTYMPVAGRMLMKQEKDWNDLSNNGAKAEGEVLKTFLDTKGYFPRDLTTKEILGLYKKRDADNKMIVKDFFTSEKAYVENITVALKHNIDEALLSVVADQYIIYSLYSKGNKIICSRAKISPLGEVVIYGSSQKYVGSLHITNGNNLLILANSQRAPVDALCYLLQIDLSQEGKNRNYFNGVRIMAAGNNSEKKPFAGRVIFMRDKHETSVRKKINFEEIYLFPESQTQKNKQSKFRKHQPGIFNLLFGTENNIVKTLSFDREANDFVRDIDYGFLFYQMSNYYANQSDTINLSTKDRHDRVLINLYYAILHGYDNVLELMNNNRIAGILNGNDNKYNQDVPYVFIDEIGSEPHLRFNEKAIDALKSRLLKNSINK